MNLNSLNKMTVKNKMVLYATAFIVVCLLFVYFFIRPVIKSITDTRASILGLKTDIEQRMAKDSTVNKINDKLEKIEPQLDKLNQVFISKNREIEFITSLEEIAVRNNITQKLNLGTTPVNESGHYKNNIEISAQGNYINALSYIRDIEKLSYYININSVDIVGLEGRSADNNPNLAGSQGNVNIKLVGFTYWK